MKIRMSNMTRIKKTHMKMNMRMMNLTQDDEEDDNEIRGVLSGKLT